MNVGELKRKLEDWPDAFEVTVRARGSLYVGDNIGDLECHHPVEVEEPLDAVVVEDSTVVLLSGSFPK